MGAVITSWCWNSGSELLRSARVVIPLSFRNVCVTSVGGTTIDDGISCPFMSVKTARTATSPKTDMLVAAVATTLGGRLAVNT